MRLTKKKRLIDEETGYGVLLNTILNRIQRSAGFVYREVRVQEQWGGVEIEIQAGTARRACGALFSLPAAGTRLRSAAGADPQIRPLVLLGSEMSIPFKTDHVAAEMIYRGLVLGYLPKITPPLV